MNLNIVLCEPQIPQNTGNISRTCAVTGAHLHLIRPMGFEVTDKNLKRAGLDYWDKLNITYYDNLAQFMDMHGNAPLCLFSTKARQTYTDTHYEDGVFLMFGREDRGLPETLLRERYDSTVRIPMRDTLRSLNLSNSVAIACYEVLRQWDFPGLERAGELSEQVQ